MKSEEKGNLQEDSQAWGLSTGGLVMLFIRKGNKANGRLRIKSSFLGVLSLKCRFPSV